MMSNFPNNFDDDTTLPIVNDNITEIGGEAINALRDAVVNIEQALGLNIAGSTSSLAARIGVFINPDGSPNSSLITNLGLVTLPITNTQIAEAAGIPESKLHLDFRTQDLFNYIRDLSKDVNLVAGWISISGIKLDPHLLGAIYRHDLTQIDVSPLTAQFLNNKFRSLRDNTNAYTAINDLNNEFLAHQWADGSPFGTIHSVVTNNGSLYPSNYGHTASGIFLDTSRFATIPQTANDLQLFADYIDNASILLLGTRIQNLYTSGISRVSRSSSLSIDGYGQSLVPVTPAIAYLKNIGNSNNPFDNIDTGDDIIELKPSSTDSTNNSFDAKFALVRVGDIIRINYGSIEVPFIIKEKKYSQTIGNKKYVVRIAGKNLFYSPNAEARIDRPLLNNNKYGVLGVAAANNSFNATPSLIITTPRGAEATGVGFSPDEFDENHYLLYLALYPTGFPQDGYTILPAIDVTGNLGTTPGLYTLESIVSATNAAFRKPGFNYRFVAFSYQGEFGIALADSYNNSAFSILSGVVATNGTYDSTATGLAFPSNVIDLFPSFGSIAPDPLGFGPFTANIASPPYMASYGSPVAAQNPTRLFVPLKRNNAYINGVEQERLSLEAEQMLDGYGDGYWIGQITDIQIPAGRVQTTYRIPLDLSAVNLKIGKTLVVQSLNQGTIVDFGRYIIQNITLGCNPSGYTDITVYDSVHGKGFSPFTTLGVDGYVAIYFNSDSVSFNTESATDFSSVSPFKRHFEVYIDQYGKTFTHERGRINASGGTLTINTVPLYGYSQLNKLDIVKISPKLRGYQFGTVNKITLYISSYSNSNGIFDGYLCSYDGSSFTHAGGQVTGKKGEIIRFYDESNIDYIDIIFDPNTSLSNFTNQIIDFQLFPTLSLDDEILLLATCQLNDITQSISKIIDARQFGNISEKDLSTSALNYISTPERLLHFNGVIRGFDITEIEQNLISINGGVALVNGSFQNINSQIFVIPKIVELYNFNNYPINWILCVNSVGELIAIPMTDNDNILGTPNDPNRVFTAYNVTSSNSYIIDSTSFSDLLNNNKLLTPLYIISSESSSNESGATFDLNNYDVRRFINDQDSNISAVLTSGNSQGNFKNFLSAVNWVKLNNEFQNTIEVKGQHVCAVDPQITETNQVNILGRGLGASLRFTESFTLNNSKFENLTVEFAPQFSGVITLSNVSFINCVVVFSSALSHTGAIFENCTVTYSGNSTIQQAKYKNTAITISSDITIDDSIINNGSLIFNANSTLNNITINNASLLIAFTINITSVAINNSIITVSAVKGFALNSECTFSKNIITWTGTPTTGYATSNLVNANSGMIFVDISDNLNSFKVNDNIFNTSLSDHFPFISLRLTDYASVLEDVNISNNQFISSSTSNDLRAVISIISTLTIPADSSAYPKFPKLVNVSIDGTMCNYDQMILISATRDASTALVGAMLATVNTKIINNTCGTIGFITASNSVADFSDVGSPNNGLIGNKSDQIIIDNNSCKLLCNLDSIGDYIPFRSTAFPTNAFDWVTVGTGAFSICNNTANWIQVGASSYSTPAIGGIIRDNKVSPANPNYLNNFTDNLVSGVTPGNVGIILRREQAASGLTHTVISGNIISQKPLVNSSGTNVTYYYDAALACMNNAIMDGNIITGVVNSSTSPMIYLSNTANVTITNNHLNRNGLITQAYVLGQNNATAKVIVTNNILDSTTIDGTNENVFIGMHSSYICSKNKNQITHIVIPFGNNTWNIPDSSIDGSNTLFQQDLVSGNHTFRVFSEDLVGGYVVVEHDIYSSDGASFIGRYSQNIAINSCLPTDINILEFKIGISGTVAFGGTPSLNTTAGFNRFGLSASSTNTNMSNYSAGINSILDSKNKAGLHTDVLNSIINLTSNFAGLLANTEYITLTVADPTLYKNNENNSISVNIGIGNSQLNWGGSAGGIQWVISPLVVKCVW